MNPTDEGQTTPGSVPPPREPGLPTRIGNYSIRRRIASGGMGTVYEAIQDEPRRPVALKVVKANMGSPEVLRRFHLEAQVLARLRHPGIAQVYEAGTHDDGHGPMPFFAMEYIPSAKSITEYAVAQNLGVRERLELFARVCDAVHHGHQKGIIHRDLKPGNILVDSAGNPHVIDFGVARATDPDQALGTVQTEVGQLIGSIAYMSPEQFEADPGDLDTRSDVYALGVVLYELLGGELPYDVMRTKIFDAARVIREASPRRLGQVKPALKGEVETIVHKALEKDRDRRYQSAYGLAEDIRRYLSGQAIAAKTSSIGYHVQVFARRNKLLLGAVAAVFVVLVGALIASTTLYLRAEQARDQAAMENVRSHAAMTFLTNAIESVTPSAYDEPPTLDDLYAEMARTVDGAFPEDPGVEAEIRVAIARGIVPSALLRSERWAEAVTHLERAVAAQKEVLGPADPVTIDTRYFLASVYRETDQTQKQLEVIRGAHDDLVKAYGAEDPRTLQAAEYLAETLSSLPRYEEAEDLATKILEARQHVSGPDSEEALRARAQLIWIKVMRGRLDEAERDARTMLATCERLFGPDHQLSKVARSELAAAHVIQGHLEAAKEIYGNRRVPDVEPQLTYQGDPTSSLEGTKLLVYWEPWCPFSQRAVPGLEGVHVRYPEVGIVGLTGVRPPTTDDMVTAFVHDKQITYTVLKVDRPTVLALNAPGTPWFVLAKDGWILWESNMDAPTALLTNLLQGMSRSEG